MFNTLTFLRRLGDDSAGNTLAIAAASLLPLTAMAGGALDLSIAYMARAKLQNACDAGVLAGRQSMTGSTWTTMDEAEAHKFFDFNFPAGTHRAENLAFDVAPNAADATELLGEASASIPTTLMRIFGKDSIDIEVTCDAERDQGDNDIVLVLDVTRSMRDRPHGAPYGDPTKIQRLRSGAAGLYRALAGDTGSVTRYGIVPYAQTVNVARQLGNSDVVKDQPYVDFQYELYQCNNGGTNCGWAAADPDYTPRRGDYYRFAGVDTKWVNINRSTWNYGQGGSENANIQGFRTSGNGCIEERPSVGEDWNPATYYDHVSADDIDAMPGNAGNQEELQYGRYDPGVQEGSSYDACPSEASKMVPYASETAFNSAINSATARVDGYTYHDIGMLWGLRWISRSGMFASENPEYRGSTPVNQHIVFMTDGILNVRTEAYSAYGVEQHQDRIDDESSSPNAIHQSRLESICSLAKARGVTVWVIVLDDAAASDEVGPCATSDAHFFFSDGSDLEEVFSQIGQGIGRLRLTQ